jgi:hypothetical protein
MAWNSGVSPTISASNFNSPSDRYPSVLGVGHNPDTFPDVRSANVNRSDNAPSRIIPHRGKITEHSGKSASNKQR